MSQARARRLTQWERQVHAHVLSMWAEVDAAMERPRTAARAHVGAVLHGHTAPERDAAQAHADRMMLTAGVERTACVWTGKALGAGSVPDARSEPPATWQTRPVESGEPAQYWQVRLYRGERQHRSVLRLSRCWLPSTT